MVRLPRRDTAKEPAHDRVLENAVPNGKPYTEQVARFAHGPSAAWLDRENAKGIARVVSSFPCSVGPHTRRAAGRTVPEIEELVRLLCSYKERRDRPTTDSGVPPYVSLGTTLVPTEPEGGLPRSCAHWYSSLLPTHSPHIPTRVI